MQNISEISANMLSYKPSHITKNLCL